MVERPRGARRGKKGDAARSAHAFQNFATRRLVLPQCAQTCVVRRAADQVPPIEYSGSKLKRGAALALLKRFLSGVRAGFWWVINRSQPVVSHLRRALVTVSLGLRKGGHR